MPYSVKEESPPSAKDSAKHAKDSPANSFVPVSRNGENASDSNAATPAAEGTPAPASGLTTEVPKKKGTKRSAAVANGSTDASSKTRGKPGPKKKPRLCVLLLSPPQTCSYHCTTCSGEPGQAATINTRRREDGTVDPAVNRTGGGHKLGPKANQGAINAGLRALDRSGKPCRKWAMGGFSLKSFTGVVWEVSRWKAPPKVSESANDEPGPPSAEGSSSKENKENGQEVNSGSNSNSGADVEMTSFPSVNASSPPLMTVTAAS